MLIDRGGVTGNVVKELAEARDQFGEGRGLHTDLVEDGIDGEQGWRDNTIEGR